jgi:chromosomal replication initiation ATPase DnaA
MSARDQIPLELGFAPAHNHDDFFVTDCNRAAHRAITDWTDWPDGRLALTGPAGAGKTHLTAIWAAQTCGVTLPAIDLTEKALQSLMLERAVAIEDVDCLAGLPTSARKQCETLLFHLFNFAGAEGASLLLTGRLAPAHWLLRTPDLASRCAAMAHIAILPPDDELLASVLIKLFNDRRLEVSADVIQYVLVRMERSFDAAERIVTDLDRLALAKRRRITRQLAGEVFDAYDAAQDPDRAGADDMAKDQGD